jgi:cell division protein FtsL
MKAIGLLIGRAVSIDQTFRKCSIGNIPFDRAADGQCMVRMQRVGMWLLVETTSSAAGHLYWPLPARPVPAATRRTKREKLNCRSGKLPCDNATNQGHFQVRSIACEKLSRRPGMVTEHFQRISAKKF